MARGHTNLGQRLCPVSREMGKGRNKCQGENQIQDPSESLENVPGASCASITFFALFTETLIKSYGESKEELAVYPVQF